VIIRSEIDEFISLFSKAISNALKELLRIKFGFVDGKDRSELTDIELPELTA
jgi:hypothetical protein